jgi:Domain of unknown function (DUF4116)
VNHKEMDLVDLLDIQNKARKCTLIEDAKFLVTSDNRVWEDLPENLRFEREVFKIAVSQYFFRLKDAPVTLRNDREIVGLSIENGGAGLRYASNELKDDFELALKQMGQNAFTLMSLSDRLQHNKVIVAAAVATNGEVLQYVKSDFKKDKEIVLIAAKQKDGRYFHHASEEIQKLVGEGDPVEVLTKAVDSEKLAAKLNNQLRPRIEPRQQSMKI